MRWRVMGLEGNASHSALLHVAPIAMYEGLGGLDDCGLRCWVANPNAWWLDCACLFLEGNGTAPYERYYVGAAGWRTTCLAS